MTRRFASGTTVDVERSRSQLERLLAEHGATQRAFYVDDLTRRARVQFMIEGRMVRLDLQIEERKDNGKPRGWFNWDTPRRERWKREDFEQREREAWRRLLLVCKAKFEIIADGSSTVEREFLADVLLPDGSTVYEKIASQLVESYQGGAMPPLLGA